MLGIGRALMASPSMLLLDEPSSGLAPRVVATLWEYLQRLRATGIPMLIVEQRTNDILDIAERGYVFVNGRVALEASAKTLRHDVDLAEIFLQAGARSASTGRTAPQLRQDPRPTDRS